jgi:hypothetical protein
MFIGPRRARFEPDRVDRPLDIGVSSVGISRTLQGHPSVIGEVALLLKESKEAGKGPPHQ